MTSSSKNKKCKNKADSFLLYLWHLYTYSSKMQCISLFVKCAYKAYSQVPLDNQEKKGFPYIVCLTVKKLLRWDKKRGLPFNVSMVWHKPKKHLTDCYFCLVNTKGIRKKHWQNIFYLNILSAIQHSDKFLPTVFIGLMSFEDEKIESEEE